MTSNGNRFLSLSPISEMPNGEKNSRTMVDIHEIVSPSIESEDSFPVASYPVKQQTPDSEPHKYLSPFISERAINQPRPLKVIYIGAGISGILAAIKFRQAVPTLDLVLYEKNPELGGTWYENRYPGCACGEWDKRLNREIY